MSKGLANKNRNKCFDTLKGFACIGVVFMHIHFPGIFGKFVFMISRFAVPFFFMISGYYLGILDDKAKIKSALLKRSKRNFLILLVSTLIYFIFDLFFIGFDFSHKELGESLLYLIFFSYFNFLQAGHLWFLLSLVYTYLFFLLLNKFDGFKVAYFFVPILFLAKIILNFYELKDYFGLFLIYAVPFVLCGHYIAKHETDIKNKFSLLICFIGIFLGIILMGIRRFFPGDISFFGVIVYSIFIFLFAIKLPNFTIKPFEFIGNKLSLHVYIFHMIVSYVLNLIVPEKIRTNDIWIWTVPITVFLLSILVGYIIITLKNAVKTASKRINKK
ncbi:MAG: acyltransferase [Treponemataceae bacterium]